MMVVGSDVYGTTVCVTVFTEVISGKYTQMWISLTQCRNALRWWGSFT